MKEESSKSAVEELIADVEAYIDEWFHGNPAFGLLRGVRWRPLTDAYETENEYRIRMSIPGMKTEDIRVVLEQGYVRVSGVRRERCSDKRRYFKMEIPAGAFERRIRVPDSVRAEEISVEYADGLLQIRLPKTAPLDVSIEMP
ncbi:MAG TPA: Hsp20/alpha crystallin family protein [Gemmatimonadota bacterium]|nr:Hsp20/alpha crystallin family protein [Gemmatimonadota bacterium]